MARVFITGSTDGLGLAAARALMDDGHDVVLHARNPERAASLDELGRRAAAIAIGDLSSAVETSEIADRVNAIGRMDAVIHSAGLYQLPERGSTPEGHATLLAVNTLAPYLLTARLHRPARLIFLSSSLHRDGAGSLEDLDWTLRPWDTDRAYAESKLQLVALALGLARRWPDVLSNAVDPGWVRTRMGGRAAPVDLATGARTQAWLASNGERAARASGGYWHDLARRRPEPEAADPQFQDDLMSALERLTGIAMP